MKMKSGYSQKFERVEEEQCAFARLEGTEASYKDLSEVCGRIRRKSADWAVKFLEMAAEQEVPVLFKKHNKRLGHRKELSGQKGRYPWKAAKIILGVLKSAISNAKVKGLSDGMVIAHVTANKKATYPRMASKGRRSRSDYELSRIELILRENKNTMQKNTRKQK